MDQFGPVINGSIKRLHETIQEQIKATNKNSQIMTCLAYIALFFTIIQTVNIFIK